GAGAAPALAPVRVPGPGNDLSEMPGEGPGPALPQRPDAGRRPAALPGRAIDRGAAGPRLAAAGPVRPAPPRARRLGLGCGGPGVSAADLQLVLPGGRSTGAAPRPGEVSAVRPASERGPLLRVACSGRRGTVPRCGGGRPFANGGVGSP